MATGNVNLCLCNPPKLGSSTSQFRASSCRCHLSPPNSTLSPPLFKTLSHIQSSGVIACLRAPSAELALGAARAALRGGIKVLEVVMSTPGVFEVLHQLVEDYPSAILGVGTILKAEDAKEAIKVGANFLMSPAMIKGLLADVQDSEVLYIPGVMTPTEILTAYTDGAKIVKIYPVSALGGTDYIAALNKSFRHIPMVASQGIKIGLIREYIARGASSVVLSDAIFDKEAVAQGDFDRITQQAHLAASTGNEAVKWLKHLKVLVMQAEQLQL